MKVGILALQGCVDAHIQHLDKLGVEHLLVRLPEHLDEIQGLILPGGESTTMIRLLKVFSLWEKLPKAAERIPFWGVCAGSILMANEVENPAQESLKIINFRVRRNAYGRQLESFQKNIQLKNGKEELAVFIRAPKFVSWDSSVFVEAKLNEEAVFLKQGKHMVTSFHPELTPSPWCHQQFIASI